MGVRLKTDATVSPQAQLVNRERLIAATLANLTGIVKQLKKERDRVRKQLLGLETALTAFAIAYSGSTPSPKRRKLSAKSRAKIAAAQRARWARVRKAKA
jgi:hypothetical protein